MRYKDLVYKNESRDEYFLKEVKVSQQEESNFQGISFKVRWVNRIIMSK